MTLAISVLEMMKMENNTDRHRTVSRNRKTALQRRVIHLALWDGDKGEIKKAQEQIELEEEFEKATGLDPSHLYLTKGNKFLCGEHTQRENVLGDHGPVRAGQWFTGCETCDDEAMKKILEGA